MNRYLLVCHKLWLDRSDSINFLTHQLNWGLDTVCQNRLYFDDCNLTICSHLLYMYYVKTGYKLIMLRSQESFLSGTHTTTKLHSSTLTTKKKKTTIRNEH